MQPTLIPVQGEGANGYYQEDTDHAQCKVMVRHIGEPKRVRRRHAGAEEA